MAIPVSFADLRNYKDDSEHLEMQWERSSCGLIDRFKGICGILRFSFLLDVGSNPGRALLNQALQRSVSQILAHFLYVPYFPFSPMSSFLHTNFPFSLKISKQIMYSTLRGKTDKLEEPVNRKLNVTRS